MPKRYALLLLAAAFISQDIHAEDARMENWPKWLKKAMVEEVRRKKSRDVEVEDGSFKSKMLGKPGPAEAMESGWYFVSDMGTESPLECYVYNTSMNLATLVDFLADVNIDAIAENYGGVADKLLWGTDAGVVSNMPTMSVEWFYMVGEAPNAAAAFTKVSAAAREDFAYACTHNELGYSETFQHAFTTFVENAENSVASTDAYYEEIAVISLGDQPLGTGYYSYSLDEEGDTRIFRLESTLTPVDQGTLSTSDLMAVTWSQPNGEMINTWTTTLENGETENEFTVQRDADDAWQISGTLQQKPVEATLDASHRPMSELGQVIVARELFAGDATTHDIEVWVDEIDPTQFIPATITRDDAEIAGKAVLTFGPISYSGMFDESGHMTEAELSLGHIKLDVRRVWSQGQIAP